jgi:deoxyribose-phosphate aldolase
MKRAELERLIDIIVDELAVEMNAESGAEHPTPGRTNPFGPVRYETPAVRCRCHAVVETCCPDRLQGVLAAGASRVGVHAAGGAPAGVAALIDHTLLRPDATRHDIETLCREAAQFAFATVCVNPTWVRFAAERLSGTVVGVCSVVGFPLGATTGDVKAYEARRAIFDGAREIDMVINVGALKSGDLRQVERDIESVTSICRDCAALSKVIIEAALLTDEEKVTACTIAKAAGADYVKTSTGFGPGGATVADVALMRRVVGSEIGVKAAGGVRDLEGLKAMVAAGASRVGASAGVRIVQQARGERTA